MFENCVTLFQCVRETGRARHAHRTNFENV